nr:helix-turn-helix transcriptional regulator [Bradyrhizobium liaoningense]
MRLVDIHAGAHDHLASGNLDHCACHRRYHTRVTRVLRAIMPLGPRVTAPGEQLRRVNADPAGDPRYTRAGLQRLCRNLRLELFGMSQRGVARSLGLAQGTVNKYLNRAGPA